jgi:tRNA modification GTPase
MLATSDTILAVGSPPGRSLRGLVRASGESAFILFEDLLEMEGSAARTRGIHPARLRLWNDLSIACLALQFPRPGSFTGDDTVELLLPGNPDLLERVIDWLVERGEARGLFARRAEAGEFTYRAFLNGRLSLTEAEGVNAAIRARSDAELRAAELLTSGALGAMAAAVARELAEALALVEAGIDFTDQEDVVAISPRELLRRLEAIAVRLRDHLNRATPFESLEAIPWVVIAGPPNAGKSTLYNALLGRERAVVSPVAGTTRDVLAEPISLPPSSGVAREAMLVDMAGLDESDTSFINVEMQRAAAGALARAELIIQCVPCDQLPPDGAPRQLPSPFGIGVGSEGEFPSGSRNTLTVITKADLLNSRRGLASEGAIEVSATTGAGLEELRGAIAEGLADRAVSLAADSFALLPRHESALRGALSHLDEASALVEPRRHARALDQPEIIASLVRLALDDVGSLAGEVTPDDILGRIFAGFCIGK